MIWYEWLGIILTAIILINITINKLANKLEIKDLMESMKDKEKDIKTTEVYLYILVVVFITILFEALKIFDSINGFLIYLAILVVTVVMTSKVSRFLVSLDKKKRGITADYYKNKEIIQKEKKTILGLSPWAFFLAAILGISEGTKSSSKRKRR